jgi:ATP/maltotriose-dependent transcriptional regulator MalT
MVEEHVARLEPRPGMALVHLAYLYAMVGRPTESVALLARGEEEIRDLGSEILLASLSMYSGASLMLMGNLVEAERTLSSGVAILQRLEERYLLSTAAGLLAQAVRAQGRTDEALRLIALSESLTAPDDPISQVLCLGVRARVLADRGELEEAETLARDATRIGDRTDFLNHRADAHVDLAHVLAAAGRLDEAGAEAEEALRLFREKENSVAAGRTEALRVRYQAEGADAN